MIADWDLERDEVNAALKEKYGITISKAGLEHYQFISNVFARTTGNTRNSVTTSLLPDKQDTEQVEEKEDALHSPAVYGHDVTGVTAKGSDPMSEDDEEGQVGLWHS